MRYITLTVIYPGHALNRDEKVGGNILSIKKLTLENAVHSVISRVAIRHYLFETLVRAHEDEPASVWQPAPVRKDGDVIQFDLSTATIFSHAELDIFGYMYTISGDRSITRKAVLGITKAVSLFPYRADIAFYANHDLARRASADPNPYNKEEHFSLYKVSFVIDTKRLGVDEWVVSTEPSEEGNELLITVGESGKGGFTFRLPIKNQPDSGVYEVEGGTITVKAEGSVYTVRFVVSEEERRRRLLALLRAIHDGLYAQSSGELNTLVPVAVAGAFVKVPTPILDSAVYWPPKPHPEGEENFCFPLNPAAIQNGWYISKGEGGGLYLSGTYGAGALLPCNAVANQFIGWEEFLERAKGIFITNPKSI